MPCARPSALRPASPDGTARLWGADGTPIATFESHSAALYTALFSPDGSHIVTTSDDGLVRLWRADGTYPIELRGHSGPVTMAAFSPDSTMIVTAGTENSVRLWRIDGTLVTTLQGPPQGSPDEARLSPPSSQPGLVT